MKTVIGVEAVKSCGMAGAMEWTSSRFCRAVIVITRMAPKKKWDAFQALTVHQFSKRPGGPGRNEALTAEPQAAQAALEPVSQRNHSRFRAASKTSIRD